MASASASSICASTPRTCHVLKIQGYSWMRKSNPNRCGVSSASFRVGDRTRWHVGFYPSGTTPETTGFVSVKAVLDAAYAAIKAVVAFDVLDHHGHPVPRFARTSGEVREFAAAGAYWSCDDFVEERHLLNVLKDDCFTVRCSITVIEILAYEYDSVPPRSLVVVPPSDSPHHFRGLLRSGEGADVMFRVAGETFAAHRCVLAARSPVFRAELYGAMKESTADCVHIHGMRPEVFRHLLHFVYTDSLPDEEDDDDGVVAMAQHLMEAADRYGMERLKLVCEHRLCTHMDVSTVATTLALAEQHHCQGLKDACFDFLINSPAKLDEAMATHDFDHLSQTCPALLKELMSKLATHSSTLTEKVAQLSAYKKRVVSAYAKTSNKKKRRRLIADADSTS
ncbi:hypothetical protein ZWY2020_059867 [Hordeum vulgare]|uniref:BTB domain-containing protein n=2 Tax=Hordeum vulgare subsp. vulgare TaxID=112509 RepID=A0A8I6X6N4_HORVV|nr:hypothetical protein ZWY2020_059867 [Hordeum vulgare]